jgi:transportin-3
LGELCDWIDCHPETLEAVLNYLLCALQAKHGLAAAAANALNSICASCKNHMTSQISGLLEIARCLDSFEIPNESAINLLKGISTIVSRLPNDQVPARMKDLCDFQLAPLHQLVVSKEKIDYGKRSDPSFWLDRLASVYRYVTPSVNEHDSHPCAVVIIDNWMILSLTMDTHQQDGKVMERVVRCVRYAVRSIGKQAIPILESLVTQIITVYSTHQHSCLLYLGSILVDEFAKEPSCNQGLLKMLQAFIEPTFKVLQQENGLKNHPDTVDDFFRLSSRFMQRLPLEFLESQLVTPILQCALLACTLDHKEANASVMKFFCNLISNGKPGRSDIVVCGLVQKIILENAQPLVSNLIYASVFSLHSYMISDVVDVFVELKHLCPGEGLRPYVKHAVEALPRLNSGGCQTATDQQLGEFVESVLCAESGRQMTQVFQNFIRLYR